MIIVNIPIDERPWHKKLIDRVIFRLLYGKPCFLNRFFRWLYYDIFKRGIRFETMMFPIIKNVNYDMSIKDINFMKRDLSDKEFIEWCNKISEYNKNKLT